MAVKYIIFITLYLFPLLKLFLCPPLSLQVQSNMASQFLLPENNQLTIVHVPSSSTKIALHHLKPTLTEI
jgi:hypothetical protein